MNKKKQHILTSVMDHEITDFPIICNKRSWKFHN